MAAHTTSRRRLLDRTFGVSMVLKGLDGAVEVIGGVLLLAVAPATWNHLAVRLTRDVLSRDPDDFFAHHLTSFTAGLAHTRTFGALYLLSHGLVKVVLVVALLRQQRWAYPAMLVFLVGFIGYQTYLMATRPSVGMGALTLFDIFVVWIVWQEFQLHRAEDATAPTPVIP